MKGMLNRTHRFLRAAAFVIVTFVIFGIQVHAQTCALPGWDGPVTASGVLNAITAARAAP